VSWWLSSDECLLGKGGRLCSRRGGLDEETSACGSGGSGARIDHNGGHRGLEHTEPQIMDSTAFQHAFGAIARPLETTVADTLEWFRAWLDREGRVVALEPIARPTRAAPKFVRDLRNVTVR
jgi:hypothetical protein